ncbi:4'-phosphopantetheinyl transferase superfamily protein [Actinospica durhamensis]|uniref:4'-phosphopantetheinyl transferase superfamily protein n=1 Tax=Actinospica durhamensis TaxID=1508375 RepID=A0A941EW65_9ACTN|nr:4'-phosphopantetheinyl transferase superfamily protein [Actinospica durhamensis]MBR7838071.1 4'-phosphopantetheinyl transferase superfamily protein [Actinospica durhamensis]
MASARAQGAASSRDRQDASPQRQPCRAPGRTAIRQGSAKIPRPSDFTQASWTAQTRANAAARAAPRRLSTRTVRHLARAAMRDLGRPEAPVVHGQRRDPLWPEGLVGSMTHCRGNRAAALARRTDVVGLGLDAEPNEPLSSGVLDVIGLPEERAQLLDLRAEDPTVYWDRLLFCVKEAIYKVWFPLAGTWLGFTVALVSLVSFGGTDGTFTVVHQIPGPPLGTQIPQTLHTLHGRWHSERGVLAAATLVPIAPVSAAP